MQKIVAFFLLLLVGCVTAQAQELPKLKAKVMSADYRADLGELARLHDELARWQGDEKLAYLAHYWSGFASWRLAMNGANHQMKKEDLMTNLKMAATELYLSIRAKDDFADAYAAAALVESWMAGFYMGSSDADFQERVALSKALFARANALEPSNPRVLWAKGAFLLYLDKGNSARGVATYREMLKEAERRGTDAASPLPDWGKAEALMSLAYAHSQQTQPDLAAARDEARAALQLVPEWSYVRDTLLPGIEKRLATP